MKNTNNVVRKHLLWQILVPALFSFALLMVGYFITNPAVRVLLISERQQMVKEMVNNTCNLLEGYDENVKAGKITLTEAQSIIIDNIKHQRYGKNHTNYFWIQDLKGHFIYHPYLTDQSGVNSQTLQSMEKVALEITRLIKTQNEGYISYGWFPINNNQNVSVKETYAKCYRPWGWVICYGFMLTDIEADLKHLTTKVLTVLFLILGGMLVVLLFVIYRNYQNLKKIVLTDTELKKSEARFRGFVGHIDNGLMILENTRPVYANRQFGEIFGINNTDVLNFNIMDYLPGWEKERVKSSMNSFIPDQNVEFGTWLLLKDKTEKYVNLRFSFDTALGTYYRYMVVQDFTEQKQTLTTLDILSQNLTQSRESILITDLNGAIEYVNPGFEKATGYTFDEVKGKNPNVLKSGKMSPMIYENLWKTISNGEIWRGELLNKKKDASLFWESTIIFPIKNRQNEIIKYSSIKTDISQTKRIEKELVAAKDKAEENERFKTAFLNNVSHEVRTPLNAIYGFTQVLKDRLADNGQAFEYLKIVEQNCQILLHLFEDILDVSSIESRSVTLKKEDVPIKGLLLKIVSKYNTQLTVTGTKPVEIIVDADNNFETMVLFTDRKRITQVFDKLISNSVKYTNKGHIKICYDIYPENITFYISDTGVGIPDQDKNLIFNNFSHGNNMFVSLHKGVGLGLNIVKLLVELMGGKLTFSSEEGQGSTFAISFSTTDLKNYKIDGNSILSYKQSFNGKNILIAEDNDENFIYFETLLTPSNNVIRAKTGIEAVALVEMEDRPLDIILMDLFMPEMDGISAARIIRKTKPDIPIIAVSAVGMALSGADLTLFNKVLTKPVDKKWFLDTIKKILEKG